MKPMKLKAVACEKGAEVMEKRKWFIKASGWVKYDSNVIEAVDESVARAEYKSALDNGLVQCEEELEYDVVDITDEGVEDEERE